VILVQALQEEDGEVAK